MTEYILIYDGAYLLYKNKRAYDTDRQLHSKCKNYLACFPRAFANNFNVWRPKCSCLFFIVLFLGILNILHICTHICIHIQFEKRPTLLSQNEFSPRPSLFCYFRTINRGLFATVSTPFISFRLSWLFLFPTKSYVLPLSVIFTGYLC